MTSREEILSTHEYDVHYYGGGRRNILEAMDQYADQQSDYWKRRAEAAEVVLRYSHIDYSHNTYTEWQSIVKELKQ